MKSANVSIVVFIDALGWEVIRGRRFLEAELPHRKRVASIFGFSSACIPSILSGLMPREHGHWSFFYYSPETSPFAALRPLGMLPSFLVDRGRVRAQISRLVKRLYGFTGYFQLYNIPFRYIHLFDYCEKRDLFAPGGLNHGRTIFDLLEAARMPYHVSDWRRSEEENLAALERDLARGEIRFALLYMAAMDALLHAVGKHHPKVDEKLAWYEARIRALLAAAEERYEEVRLFICSDHGMAEVKETVDLMGRVESLGLRFGKDYVATYDATMGRFWFLNDRARRAITAMLAEVPQGRMLPREELARLGCDFEGDRFGEGIFLLEPGVIINPSHMGTEPMAGMHGYHPETDDAYAVLLANVPPPVPVEAITDVFHLMRREAGV